VRDVLGKNINDGYYYEITAHKQDIIHDLITNGIIESLDDDWVLNLNVSTYKRSGAKKNISPCLLAGEGGNCTFYLTSERRRLTEYEYLRLQGFPPNFKVGVSRSKTYKQAGNAMSVNVLCFIVKNALRTIIRTAKV
jgi:DNA (cytosine-5)-methyltransferase 1